MAVPRWLLALVAVLALAGAVAACGGDDAGSADAATTEIGAFPMPGTLTASPETQISLRGAPAGRLGTITVTGSKTGAHTGRLEPHSDGQGASYVLDEPFQGGETVTVKTDLNIPGAKDGDYTFKTVPRPKAGLQSNTRPDPKLLHDLVGQVGKPPKGVAITYHSRPDLRPPLIELRHKADHVAPGYVFIAPKKVFGGRPRKGLQAGPMIIDNAGNPVWFAQNNAGNVTDFRIQQYGGQPVMTWWQGRSVLGTGEGVVKIVDPSFKTLKTVQGGNGYRLDFHDTTITPQGTLLGIVFNPVSWDLSSVGGSKHARVVDAVAQEIDIKTGLVLFEWHSIGHIALSESHEDVPKGSDALYDYVHPNSLTLTPDGDLLLSGRALWGAVRLDRRTGRMVARYGGKKSDYKMVGAARFAFQHDVHLLDGGKVLRIFDNEAAPQVRDQTRGLFLNVDDAKKTLSVRHVYDHKPNAITAGTQGDVQQLPNGDVFMGWGSQGWFTEFAPDGRVKWDARIERGEDTYRAYRFPFVGTPPTDPAVATANGGRTVWVSWNGATQVRSWTVLAGDSPGALKPVTSSPKHGFETTIHVPRAARYLAVQAKDGAGKVLGTSKTVRPNA